MRGELHAAGAQVIEALALNDQQRRALFDPSPAIDSLAEELVALREHGVPDHVVRRLVGRVGEVITLNGLEGACEHDVSGRLDRLRHAARARTDDALTVKGLARALRPDLAVLARGERAREFTAAALRVQDVIRSADPTKLRSRSLRNELGGGRHDLLLAFISSAERTAP